jgi:hypothetical protein
MIFCSVMLTGKWAYSQCFGNKGPNLLGARGTFSRPFITPNTSAASCIHSGGNSYSPAENVGNALSGCNTNGEMLPCSGYTYTSASGGLGPEGRYSILKVIGNSNGGNCIKGDWRGADHTGDGGYFMAVNGAPNNTISPVFFEMKAIPVCIGSTYEFSAWAINLFPSGASGTEPNLSFKVNGNVIANSGPLRSNTTPIWVKISGSFTATTDRVDLQIVNATSVASGNDVGIDDISFNTCQSQISVSGPSSVCSGNPVGATFTVTDPTRLNKWYKWQRSTDGGSTFTNLTTGAQGTYVNNTLTLTYNIGTATTAMNGYKYRLVVASSQAALNTPTCGLFNDYTLIVADCNPTPVKLTAFSARYSNGSAYLDWQTSQEIDAGNFEVLRSADGVNFTRIATVASAGNSNNIRQYSYQDNTVEGLAKYAYYRLRQLDLDGKASLSNIARITLDDRTGIDIYPNPFNSQFTLTITASEAENASLVIRNITGQTVHSRNLTVNRGNNTIVLSDLPNLGKGTYYVQVHSGRFNYNKKMQKN